jgi:hypothetical protein
MTFRSKPPAVRTSFGQTALKKFTPLRLLWAARPTAMPPKATGAIFKIEQLCAPVRDSRLHCAAELMPFCHKWNTDNPS